MPLELFSNSAVGHNYQRGDGFCHRIDDTCIPNVHYLPRFVNIRQSWEPPELTSSNKISDESTGVVPISMFVNGWCDTNVSF